MREARAELTRRWLERIAARVSLDANQVFPTDQLLDHVPILIDGIAEYVENPTADVAADPPVIAKAMELGDMRHAQGFDAYQIFKEYEILGSILFHFLASVADEIDLACTREELLHCSHRVFEAVTLIQQATSMQFLRQTQAHVRDRENRLRGFNRTVSHELKNRVGAATGAVDLLAEAWLDDEKRGQFLRMASENLEAIRDVLENLLSLSRLEEDARQQRNIRLSEAVGEVFRRLRDFARSRSVALQIDEPLPVMEVNAAAVELCLSNYVSNAVKYSDPGKSERWVRVRAVLSDAGRNGRGNELIVEVWDNGLGIPAEAQSHLFERFFRAHAETVKDVEGTGLGLSIVRETVEDLGGRAWAKPVQEGGSVFAFAIPATRKGEVRDSSTPSRKPTSDAPGEVMRAP
jgi:signal transduction histidine kinase